MIETAMKDQERKSVQGLESNEVTIKVANDYFGKDFGAKSAASGQTAEASPSSAGKDSIADIVKSLRDLEAKVKGNFQENKEDIKESKNIAYLGFFALTIVVIGFAFSYFEFFFGGVIIDVYRRDLGVRVDNHEVTLGGLKSENERLKSQFDLMEKILDCQKAKDKRYWEYQKCFE